MASEFAIGLPNQALKAIASSYSSDVSVNGDFSAEGSSTLVAATPEDIVTFTASSGGENISSILVQSTSGATIWRVYVDDVLQLTYNMTASGVTEKIPVETLSFAGGSVVRLEAEDTGTPDVIASMNGTTAAAGELFSQILA